MDEAGRRAFPAAELLLLLAARRRRGGRGPSRARTPARSTRAPTRVVLENEHVRVLEYLAKPGSACAASAGTSTRSTSRRPHGGARRYGAMDGTACRRGGAGEIFWAPAESPRGGERQRAQHARLIVEIKDQGMESRARVLRCAPHEVCHGGAARGRAPNARARSPSPARTGRRRIVPALRRGTTGLTLRDPACRTDPGLRAGAYWMRVFGEVKSNWVANREPGPQAHGRRSVSRHPPSFRPARRHGAVTTLPRLPVLKWKHQPWYARSRSAV
jgi:hypothetical protein